MVQEKILIAVVDDHILLADSLKNVLQQVDTNFEVVVFYDLKKFENRIKHRNPFNFILLDVLVDEENGIVFYKNNPDFFSEKNNVILLTSVHSKSIVIENLNSGIKGFMCKNCDIDELLDAFENINKGKIYISDFYKEQIIFSKTSTKDFSVIFTPREQEILDLLCASRTAKEIAFDLNLSINTVQMYVKSLFKKTHQNRTTDLVLYSIKNGLNNPIS